MYILLIEIVAHQFFSFFFADTNSFRDILEQVSILVDVIEGDDFKEVASKVLPLLPYNSPGQAFVAFEKPDGVFSSGKFANTMRFIVKEVNIKLGAANAFKSMFIRSVLNFMRYGRSIKTLERLKKKAWKMSTNWRNLRQGRQSLLTTLICLSIHIYLYAYKMHGLLNSSTSESSLQVSPSDYFSKKAVANFKNGWEGLGPEFERVDEYDLGVRESLNEAVQAVIEIFGLQPCEVKSFHATF